MYDTAAFLYDTHAAFEAPNEVCDQLAGLFTGFGLQPPGTIGDLGCGTGVFSFLLAERGWNVLTIERSAAMLNVAQKKILQWPESVSSRICWRQGDITDFETPPLDGAVCLCNTVNHLNPEQVRAFAACTYRALRPGGVLVLDSDTLATFLGFFDHEPTVVLDDGNHRLTRACRFDSERGQAFHTALLEHHQNGGWHRIGEEAMTLHYHPEKALYETFEAAGFRIEGAEPFNPNPTLYAVDFIPKVLWTLQKPL